jgi:oligopeptide/dipeptide ABC transporter ATP-binding protein
MSARGAAHDIVLDVQNLKTYFFTYDGVVRALEGVNMTARAGETTGVVGETGCGKSVTAFSVARLISEPGRVISGKVMFNGANLLWGLEREAKFRRIPGTGRVKVIRYYRRIKAGNERMSAVRGRGIGMIFQEPSQAMNPVFSIANQLGEAIQLHRGIEMYETMLLADRAWWGREGGTVVTAGDFTPEGAETAAVAAPVAEALPELVDALLRTTAGGNQEEMRAAASAIATSIGLPTLGTELFYLVRDAGAQAASRRPRIMRTIRRARLTTWQRNFLRYQRRLALMQRALNDLYMKEMRFEKPARRARASLSIRMRLERLRHFYFGLWGIKRRVSQPVTKELFWRSVELLEGVRIANPVSVARGFPHELSGGMLQRAMIAMALSCDPALLLADEPTTALDVTIQAQILDLMRQLRERVGTAIVLITHDLGVVAEVCDRVNVMYAGEIVEYAPAKELFRRPLHPYTQGLLASIPRFDQPDKQLSSIPGSVPNLIHPPPGCRFHPRCPYAMPVCKTTHPVVHIEGEEHMVACHLYTEPAPTPAAAPST